MKREDFSFLHRLRVRWAEVDMQGIVFNGHYLTYFDVAFTEYWRATGLPNFLEQAAAGHEMYARKASIEYFASARFDDELDIGVRCAAIGRSSVRFEIGIFCGDAHLITGELLYVHAHAAEKKSVPLPQAWRERLLAVERVAPVTA